MNQRQAIALTHVHHVGQINLATYRRLCPHWSPETLRLDLADLVKQGHLAKQGAKRGTFYTQGQGDHMHDLDPLRAQFAEDFAERLPDLTVEFVLTGVEAWALLSAIQLATRHPRFTGPTAQIAAKIARGVESQLAVTPALAAIAAAGWDQIADDVAQPAPTLCTFADDEGLCAHPDNRTPECHRWACPLARSWPAGTDCPQSTEEHHGDSDRL